MHRRPWTVLLGSSIVLAASVLALLHGGTLSALAVDGAGFPSTQASRLVDQGIPAQRQPGSSSLLLILRSTSMRAGDRAFQQQVDAALRPLEHDPRVAQVVRTGMTSQDGRAVLLQVFLFENDVKASSYFPELLREARAAAPELQVDADGQVPIRRSFGTTLDSDLRRAELISLPITLLLLVLIFGSVPAAVLPLGIGLLTIVTGIGATLTLAHLTTVSQYAINVVTLIGLGVSIDYSLFIVTRFREELARERPVPEALAVTLSTAGRAVAFSGLTVGVGLAALLFFPGSFLTSIGESGALVVGVAVLYALTFLPACLAILGPAVTRLRMPFVHPRSGGMLWYRVALRAMRRPLLVMLPTLTLLLLAAVPFLHIRLATTGIEQLPPGSQARTEHDKLLSEFPSQDQTVFTVVVRYAEGDPLSPERTGNLSDLTTVIQAIPGVVGVSGPVSVNPSLDRAGYQRLYAQPRDRLPPAVQQVVHASVGAHIVMLTAVSDQPATSQEARQVLAVLRKLTVPDGRVLVGGYTATDVDTVDFMLSHVPAAIGFAIGVTLIVLFVLTGSIVMPLKALLTNLVSISASFGALVWTFQDGHLQQALGFTPQPIDPSIPVLLFAVVFGLSMDYEVLLVTRVQEQYRATANNDYATVVGLARAGGLITGAAAIMVTVFCAFAMGQVVLIKAIGLGLAIAVLVDATLVRALVVPSLMRLMGEANWWAPAPLRWLHERVGIREDGLQAKPLPAHLRVPQGSRLRAAGAGPTPGKRSEAARTR